MENNPIASRRDTAPPQTYRHHISLAYLRRPFYLVTSLGTRLAFHLLHLPRLGRDTNSSSNMRIPTLVTVILAPLALAQTPLYVSTPPKATSGIPVNITYTAPDMTQVCLLCHFFDICHANKMSVLKPVTILLLKGDPANLSTVGVLTGQTQALFPRLDILTHHPSTDDQKTSPYTWVPAASLQPANNYALEITQGNVTNYSAQFTISGGTASAISSASSASSAASSAKSSYYSSALSAANASSVSMTATTLSSVTSLAGLNSSTMASVTPTPGAIANGSTTITALYNATASVTAPPVLASSSITAAPNRTKTRTRHYNTTSTCTSVTAAYSNEAVAWNAARPWAQAVVALVIGAVGLTG